MSLLSENIIPGDTGRVFATNAEDAEHLKNIKTRLLELNGIKDVKINFEVFPREMRVFTSKLISVADVEKAAMTTGFHIIPKESFEL
ncbi:MAG: heavy-metal-associated domain-containing protein [Mesonia hippocampi]|uniref:heavy-metal-associated domain-containing protein n=1 Tax=Mesonia hippocampi TaxID=1628250 RepID=UPI003F9BFBA9